MEPQPQTLDFASTVDTSSAFRSVKEAIAVFGERLLVKEIGSPSPSPALKPIKRENSWRFTSSPVTTTAIKGEDDVSYNYNDHQKNYNNNNSNGLLETLKKVEAELEETKMELKQLKERENDTEVALATLNAELHKNMSKLAQAEAAAAGKAAGKTVRFDERLNHYKDDDHDYVNKGEIVIEEEEVKKKKKKKETLAQILSVGERESYNNNYYYLGEKMGERKMKKKMKPIIPLVGGFFSKKKGSPTNHHNPLYASPFFYD
ncbi:uncharacterized protein LOC129307253 [Prosopis cineraria]|uniref:uncharacterized protein LOC129307253 n=1 Tax=Prosopis cineraria TaxID=364024 RepID=UPI00240EC6DD|nr:uncharacterized protein LOC129307253 [Prosopis cineraria]